MGRSGAAGGRVAGAGARREELGDEPGRGSLGVLRRRRDVGRACRAYKDLMRIEKKLGRQISNLGRAAHLQVVLKKGGIS